jgi:hypothetical protein
VLPRAASLVLLLATSASTACARSGDAPSDASPKPSPETAAALENYPLNRLRFAHNPVEALDLPAPLAEDELKARGVKSHRAFVATDPQVWLLVFEFADRDALLAAALDPRLVVPREPPYHTATAFTGDWLLVAGFPTDAPVSPKMKAAQTVFLESWYGQQ